MTCHEVQCQVNTLESICSPGNDKIHNLLLKNLPIEGIIPLTHLINKAIEQGPPEDWKIAIVNDSKKTIRFDKSI